MDWYPAIHVYQIISRLPTPKKHDYRTNFYILQKFWGHISKHGVGVSSYTNLYDKQASKKFTKWIMNNHTTQKSWGGGGGEIFAKLCPPMKMCVCVWGGGGDMSPCLPPPPPPPPLTPMATGMPYTPKPFLNGTYWMMKQGILPALNHSKPHWIH